MPTNNFRIRIDLAELSESVACGPVVYPTDDEAYAKALADAARYRQRVRSGIAKDNHNEEVLRREELWGVANRVGAGVLVLGSDDQEFIFKLMGDESVAWMREILRSAARLSA
ncbi:hypothetical protein N0V90_007666 [Kalmusia sp. IMI 367209]|nr:hypothetical protein N0V90_007666 [Kalmusia sp. IMI 367209]